MASFPVKLVLPWGSDPKFMVHPQDQCIFEVIIPLGLPRVIDPSIPSPPYRGADEHNRLQLRVRPVMKPVLTGLLTTLMGQDYPVHSILGAKTNSRVVLESFEANFLLSSAELDLKTGRWRDQFGRGGQTAVDALAYDEHPDGTVALAYAFNFTLTQGRFAEEHENPRVIRFEARDQLDENGKVVFVAKEYTEQARIHINSAVNSLNLSCKVREEQGIAYSSSLL